MAWCGMVWYGVVWYGMVWCGIALGRVVSCHVEQVALTFVALYVSYVESPFALKL